MKEDAAGWSFNSVQPLSLGLTWSRIEHCPPAIKPSLINYAELHLLRVMAFICQIQTPQIGVFCHCQAHCVLRDELSLSGPFLWLFHDQEGKTSEVKLSQQIPPRHPTPLAVLAAADPRHAFSCQHPRREIRALVFKARCSASFPACTHANLLGWPPACSQVVCQDQQGLDTKEREVAWESLLKPSCWHPLWKRILTVTARSKWLPRLPR